MHAATSCPTHGSQQWRSNQAASSSRPTGTTHAFPICAGGTRWTSRGLALPFKSVTEIYRPESGRFDSRRGGLRFLASIVADVFVDETPPLIANIDLVRAAPLTGAAGQAERGRVAAAAQPATP
jgi:hypothetical protein